MTTVNGKTHLFNAINLEISRVYTTKEINTKIFRICTIQVSRLPIGFQNNLLCCVYHKIFSEKTKQFMRAQAPVEKKYYRARARFHRSVRFLNRPVRNRTLTPLNNRKNHRRQVTDSVMAQ